VFAFAAMEGIIRECAAFAKCGLVIIVPASRQQAETEK
jgi:hypothetical protein